MARIRVDRDLRPVSEFRANAAALINRVRTTKRSVVLTQHGRGAVVLVDVHEYERMIEALEGSPGFELLPPVRSHDPVEAYKSGIDRSLIRENLARPVGERLRRLAELARFAESLRAAPRRNAVQDPEEAAPSTGSNSS